MTDFTDETLDSPPVPRVGRLDRASDVRVELARLYRSARKGDLPISDAARLGYLLSLLGRLIETSDLEQRIERLEKTNEQNRAF